MRTKNSPNKTTTEFNHLVKNAFDFLTEAIDQFKVKPKYSVINFCAGVELILKARLFREHWTLIIDKVENATQENLHQGKFQSVNVREAQKRLKNILNEDMATQVDCFLKLAAHRNQMIHFYHRAEIKQEPHGLAVIAAEQCRAWYYLHGLMTNRWSRLFAPHLRTIAELDGAMRGHREYLTTKFSQMKDELAVLEEKGRTVLSCPSCGYHAMISLGRLGDLSQMECRVYGLHRPYMVISCPVCQGGVHFHLDYFDAGFALCPKCGRRFTAETLCEILDEHQPDDPYETWQRPRCADCGTSTVISYHGKWVCASCLRIFSDISFCEYCNTAHAGLCSDGSYFNGCPECDGKAGVIASRDD